MNYWELSIRETVLYLAWSLTTTGGAEAAEDLLAGYGWSYSTSVNSLSQIRKWWAFCDERGQSESLAGEGDFIRYIGYLSMEGKVGPKSDRQFFSAVSRYHEYGGF